VFWPLSQFLLDLWGWRATFGAYAALQVVLCLPIHALVVPKYARLGHAGGTSPRERSPAFGDARRKYLNAAFAVLSFIVGVVAVHMVSLLTATGLTQAQAVIIGVLMGPMQVAGRIVEITLLRRTRSTIVGAIAFVMIGAATAIAAVIDGRFAVAVAFVVLYGFGNGIFTVVRGSVPAEIWGTAGLGELLGSLAGPSLVARALAPGAYSLLLTLGFTRDAALYSLTALALAALAGYAHATTAKPPP
jgi:predicted MFS family arabinose efflux permease